MKNFGVKESTCLKGIAILMMLIHHCFLAPERYEGQEVCFLISEWGLNYVALFFKICVCIFVFISAYGITCSIKKAKGDSPEDFVRKLPGLTGSRMVKLLGGFIFVFLLADVFALFYDPGRFAAVYGTEFPLNVEYFFIDMFGLAELLQTPTFLATYWYYSLAVIIVLAVPLFYLLKRRIGAGMFLAAVTAVTFTISFQNVNIWRYILCVAVGVVCADDGLIERYTAWQIKGKLGVTGKKAGKFFLYMILLLLLMVVREGELKNVLYPVFDAVIPVVLTCFCCEFIFVIPLLADVLKVLGKHSLNIFLVHNYIRAVWFGDYTYSFRYPALIVFMLLMESLLLSIVIEALKRLLRYDRLIGRLAKKAVSGEW